MRLLRNIILVTVLALVGAACATETNGGSGGNGDGRITIAEPQEGATVSGSVAISGEASVFEATVTIRLRDPSGDVQLETFTTATAGAPERGTWTIDVAFPDEPKGIWSIEAVEISSEDGSDAFVTSRTVIVA